MSLERLKNGEPPIAGFTLAVIRKAEELRCRT
jgi:hypothetical protein